MDTKHNQPLSEHTDLIKINFHKPSLIALCEYSVDIFFWIFCSCHLLHLNSSSHNNNQDRVLLSQGVVHLHRTSHKVSINLPTQACQACVHTVSSKFQSKLIVIESDVFHNTPVANSFHHLKLEIALSILLLYE